MSPTHLCPKLAWIISSFVSDTAGNYKETKTGEAEKCSLTRQTKTTGVTLTKPRANETPLKVSRFQN